MITLHEQFEADRPRHEAFAYISDFSTAAEWDHTTLSAEKISPGPVAVGTQFELVCRLPVGSLDITYTVTRLVADELVELRGESALFSIRDVIQLSDTAEGCHIDYRATFDFRGPLGRISPAMRSGLERMGKQSVAGMKAALDDRFPAPAARRSTRRADDWVVPGVVLFSSRGYRRGRKHWHPVSAWMGDKHVVITGASSGIGYATAEALARAGASLTLVIRNEDKAEALVASLRRETGNPAIRVELADLSLMADVNRLVRRLDQRGEAIDVLINNAGALFTEWGQTAEGLERSFALLTLAPYRLVEGLKPLLLRAPAARVINVVSGGMYTQKLDVARLQAPEAGYSGAAAYAQAKRALMVLTEQWADDWAPHGIVVNAMHPGWADTPGVSSSLPGFHRVTRRILRSPHQGADTVIWLARATEAGRATGLLFLDREPRPTHLLASTRETLEQRESLRQYMKDIAGKRRAGSTRALTNKPSPA